MTLTNSFHNTECNIRANVGDTVSEATIRRARKALCPVSDCKCGLEDGTRHSRYRLMRQDFTPGAGAVVVDGREQ